VKKITFFLFFVMCTFGGISTSFAKESVRYHRDFSYYDNMFHGRHTASGVVYNRHNEHLAADNNLSLGSAGPIYSKRTGKMIFVVIADRMAEWAAKKRRTDLSEKASLKLGYHKAGLMQGDMQVLIKPTKHITPEQREMLIRHIAKTPSELMML